MRVLAYHASRDLVPLYSVYALLFADHGLSAGEISSLLVLWSLTSFACEVPSGAWADTIDRRRLLVLSSVVLAAAFASWTLRPTYAGFALGFVLWGVSSALESGTFESLLYDELRLRGRTPAYPRLIGRARALALVAVLVADGLAVPLLHVGGYGLLGLASVVAALLHGVLAATLPVRPEARRPTHTDEPRGGRYLAMLGTGLRESARVPAVRRALLVASVLVGLTAYDEYFPLVARDHGVPTASVPVLIAVTTLAQAVGTALAGRTPMSGRALGLTVAAGAVLVSLGAAGGPAIPAAYAGFVPIALGYGLLNNAMIVAETRLQDRISGPARATVTSVLGVGEEATALVVYASVGLGSTLVPVTVAVALVGVPVAAGALVAAAAYRTRGVRAGISATGERRL